MGIVKWFLKHSQWVRNNRGGGQKERTVTVTPPQINLPSATQAMQGYLDSLRRAQAGFQEMFPQQASLYNAYLGKLQSALESPNFITPEEQAQIDAIRNRETQRGQTLECAHWGQG